MTAPSQYNFALEIDTSVDAPKLVVSDTTNAGAVLTYTQPLPRSGLPYTLMLWHSPQAPDVLTIVPADALIQALLTRWDATLKAALGDAAPPAATPQGVTLSSVAPKNALGTSADPSFAPKSAPASSAVPSVAPENAATSAASSAVPSVAPKNATPTPTSVAPENARPVCATRSTNGPQYWLELTLDASPGASTLTVRDTTNPAAISTSKIQLPSSKPPYVLEVAPALQSSNTLTITARPSSGAFDPNVTSGRSVLQFSAAISDHRLATRDDTRYKVKLKNVSEYYIAEEIQVRLVLNPITKLTDGSDPLVIIPAEQRVRCIEPGAEHDVVFSVITRGIQPGDYPLRVYLTYRIVYWDGRQTSTTYSQMLTVRQ